MKIIYCGELIRTPDAPDHMGIIQGLDWLKDKGEISDYHIVDPILSNSDDIVAQVAAYNPDVVVHGNTDSFKDDIIQRITDSIITKQVFFMGDYQPDWIKPLYHGLWKHWAEQGATLSSLFISNYDQIPMWQQNFGKSVHFLPHGCYVPKKLVKNEEYENKVVFIGSRVETGWLSERTRFLEQLQKEVGFEWVDKGTVEGRNEIWRQMPGIYHGAACVIDMSHEWRVRGYASGRYWYTAGLGACSISKRFPGCEDFYEDKVHKAYFDTLDEAVELIKFYIQHEPERESMKKAAWKHNIKYHNYEIRFRDMFSKIY